MNLKITLITLFLTITFFSCKQNIFNEYKYNDKPNVLVCEELNTKLYQEALYSFEDDIVKYYSKTNPNANLIIAYSQFTRAAIYGRVEYENIVTEHTLKIIEALKKEENLWAPNNFESKLNYKSEIIKCISKNLNDKNIKTTFNALVSTNSMAPKLFGTALKAEHGNALNDKYLAIYIALDFYYAKLYELDLTEIDFDKPKPNLDFNVIHPEE